MRKPTTKKRNVVASESGVKEKGNLNQKGWVPRLLSTQQKGGKKKRGKNGRMKTRKRKPTKMGL